jgi:probable addiction module antidote protein
VSPVFSANSHRKFDPVNYLKNEKELPLYLEACLKEGGDDPAYIAAALGDIARARGISVAVIRRPRDSLGP